MQRGLPGARDVGWNRLAIVASVVAALAGPLSARAAEAAPPPQVEPPAVATEVVLRALSMLGVRYKFGGNSPRTGLDCSGLVRKVFEDVVGVVLPRRAIEMSHAGEAIGNLAQLKPGDLVFFRTIRRAVSHVGIYIGNNEFVHAPSRHGRVRVDSLDESYWRRRFVSARRMLLGEDGSADGDAADPRAADGTSSGREVTIDPDTWAAYLASVRDRGTDPRR